MVIMNIDGWMQMLSRTRRQEADNSQHVTMVTAAPAQTYTEMQKTMMDDLEKRRHDWEKEMQRMQEDFFQVSGIQIYAD